MGFATPSCVVQSASGNVLVQRGVLCRRLRILFALQDTATGSASCTPILPTSTTPVEYLEPQRNILALQVLHGTSLELLFSIK